MPDGQAISKVGDLNELSHKCFVNLLGCDSYRCTRTETDYIVAGGCIEEPLQTNHCNLSLKFLFDKTFKNIYTS